MTVEFEKKFLVLLQQSDRVGDDSEKLSLVSSGMKWG